ncbi:hypothetical protein QYE76_048944 [Lolium multiflorum]|uniref:Integrase catalytic domain-containing protein n=1 Tax=Lolium multiflorum TaxID=4521 RepID=A0AAD8SMW0_LOLMU|nr:hypothetical protein QYE76_048944 [Lolium multiflorum]
MGIKLIRSSPYYAQANGQAEASNKSLIKLIKRKIDEYPRRWHEVLSEALWAYRMSCHVAIKTSPYHLVYGQEAVLPWEITAGSKRTTFQNDLTTEEYAALMSDSIEDATELGWSLEKIKENKAKVSRAYNKKVKPKEFLVGDLVWEAVLPLGTKDKAYGKWSPNWHGPYKVDQVLKGNAYLLEQLDGVKFPVAVNGQHLKKYFPSMWDDGHPALLPNLRAVAALVVAVVAAVAPAAGGLLVADEATGASSSSSSSSDPARKRLAGGYLGGGVLLRLFFLLSEERSASHEKRSSSLPPPAPRQRGTEVFFPSVRGSSSSDSMEESQSLASQYSGARAS